MDRGLFVRLASGCDWRYHSSSARSLARSYRAAPETPHAASTAPSPRRCRVPASSARRDETRQDGMASLPTATFCLAMVAALAPNHHAQVRARRAPQGGARALMSLARAPRASVGFGARRFRPSRKVVAHGGLLEDCSKGTAPTPLPMPCASKSGKEYDMHGSNSRHPLDWPRGTLRHGAGSTRCMHSPAGGGGGSEWRACSRKSLLTPHGDRWHGAGARGWGR